MNALDKSSNSIAVPRISYINSDDKDRNMYYVLVSWANRRTYATHERGSLKSTVQPLPRIVGYDASCHNST